MKNSSWIIFLCVVLAIGNASVFAQVKDQKAEIKFGFLQDLKQMNGGFQIKIDYAEMFEGETAEREAKKDGEPSPGETSGIYIRNKNAKIHVEKLAAKAVFLILQQLEPLALTPKEFDLLRNNKLVDADGFWGFPDQYKSGGEPMPCRVTVKNGAVTKIEQVYFP